MAKTPAAKPSKPSKAPFKAAGKPSAKAKPAPTSKQVSDKKSPAKPSKKKAASSDTSSQTAKGGNRPADDRNAKPKPGPKTIGTKTAVNTPVAKPASKGVTHKAVAKPRGRTPAAPSDAPSVPLPKHVEPEVEDLGEPQAVPRPEELRSDAKPKKNRAGLGVRDLEHFRHLLLLKRAELVGDVSSMEREALQHADTNLSTLPVHMADQGTDAYEQEFTLGLVEKDRELLREINAALAKIHDGSYGLCEGTGEPIGKPRLEARPWAKYSIEYARKLEKPSYQR